MGEFELIRTYFKQYAKQHSDVMLGIGDDCAITLLKPNQRLVTTTDMLVQGTHFFPDISPADLAYKSVAVNLSDLAAMGARPRWISLALSLPRVDSVWLEAFSRSLFEILTQYNVALIGGDTVRGELSLTITAQGVLPQAVGLLRKNAKVGDWIFVSGSLGESAAGLDILFQSPPKPLSASQQWLVKRHLSPTPRVELGQFLTQFSQCAIDISDGLLADLRHILEQSQVGAEIRLEQLPLSDELLENYSLEQAEKFALTGGEDYELCFTVSDEQMALFSQAVKHFDVSCHCIGRITAKTGKLELTKQGKVVSISSQDGFHHFN
ncbi:thiamine-phosphate kinase [Nicoletella semolina]|uniref:Thiamine-monophosphate kinase n=1 Tax=Nicoletella semolina TaxID=271160 RepID=A0A4V2SK88_9PAST|nr:thiamine-phosphate kinase [Nicoletella semolina]MDH2925056.1 thiamine-phosphate kinase [Nicoletella semolina]TCP18606.1 thiamine-phosphate kinase [Nicoletella semolina]